LKPRIRGQSPLVVKSAVQWASLFLAFIVAYFLLGLAGLSLQSSQTGVSPAWPASGFAFAMVYWFGIGQALAILPAMLGLAAVAGVPFEVAAISAGGSILEAAVPAYLMRRLKLDPGLRHLRDTLLFVAIGPVLGPIFSATIGSLAFHLVIGAELEGLRLWLLWWLGNSVGFLLVGGFGLVAVARRSLRLPGKRVAEMAVACAAVVAITALGMLQVVSITSPLVLYLLIPVFIIVAQRAEQFMVLLLGVTSLIVMLISSTWLPAESLAQTDLGIIYLDVGLVWVVTFTGMVISSARQEMRAREEVSWLASHDPLTRLLNRNAFMDQLEQVLLRHGQKGGDHVLMYIDLDRFKALNDAEGHRAGDQVLRDVGAMLVEELRGVDAVARLGGDEFAAILEGCSLLDACAIAENLRSLVERYEYQGNLGHYRVEVSIGLCELSPGHLSPEEALHDADSACYEAKRTGRNRVTVSSRFAQDANSPGAGQDIRSR